MKRMCGRHGWAGAGMIALFLGAGAASGAEEWWGKSFYREMEPTNGLKAHVELSGGGENLTGNESGYKAKGAGLIALRRQMLTMYVDGSYSFEDKTYGTLGALKQTTYMVRDTLRCDLGKRIYVSGGLVEERDDVTFIKSREGVFGGVGYEWPILDSLQVTAYGAVGNDSVKYDLERAGPSPYTGPDNASSPGWIMSLQGVWQVNERVSVRPDGLYVAYMDDDLTDRWEAGTSLQFDLMPNLSMTFRYEMRTEENPVLKAIGGDSNNTAFKWMFRVSY